MKRREVLLNPGPVNVSDRVRDALLRGDMCHREPEFQDLMSRVRAKLARHSAPHSRMGLSSPVVVSWCTAARPPTAGSSSARATAATSGGSVHGASTSTVSIPARRAISAIRSP